MEGEESKHQKQYNKRYIETMAKNNQHMKSLDKGTSWQLLQKDRNDLKYREIRWNHVWNRLFIITSKSSWIYIYIYILWLQYTAYIRFWQHSGTSLNPLVKLRHLRDGWHCAHFTTTKGLFLFGLSQSEPIVMKLPNTGLIAREV